MDFTCTDFVALADAHEQRSHELRDAETADRLLE